MCILKQSYFIQLLTFFFFSFQLTPWLSVQYALDLVFVHYEHQPNEKGFPHDVGVRLREFVPIQKKDQL